MTVSCPIDAPVAQERLCETCLRIQPINQFRRRRRDGENRMRQCRHCHNELERWRRAAIRARMTKRAMAKVLTDVRNTSSNRLKTLCAAMVRGYGGTEGFANAWLSCLRQDLGKGGTSALRQLEATLRLIQHCDHQRPDYGSLTDEELVQLHAEAVRGLPR